MRNIININSNWQFSKDNEKFENVTLPHTWNNLDGQDGGDDYLRQECFYKKELEIKKQDGKIYVEFEGSNHITNVTFNGKYLGKHEGGFSTFRFDITNLIEDKNILEVKVDNSEDIPVYPQKADFTFFGGIYRNVNIVQVSKTHFDLEYYGSNGIYITPVVKGNTANVNVKAYIKGDVKGEAKFTILDDKCNVVKEITTNLENIVDVDLVIDNPTLWNGRINPYLYTLNSEIIVDGKITDNKEIKFGVRDFSVDSEKGFILNNNGYSLRGISRHQDTLNKGWAVSNYDHYRDMELIKEVGANTIRLAHYQHSQFFYDLCDESGMVIWAEIPFITMFIEGEEAKQNTILQMKELVLQNYNHPSICFWGISNEITIGGESDALLQNQKELDGLVKSLDKTRLTTLANVSFVESESEQNNITNIIGYNHYFGWYGGELKDNEEWIDSFHEKYPNRSLCISEYGAEGILALHTDSPECRDYTEEYHSAYHEHMVKIFEDRPFIWGTYQWNMFDFAADAREEGGIKGRNNKGLVSYGRDIKKDAFYLYKAYWNKSEKFIHITGRRYFERIDDKVNIKLYSNLDEITLFINGEKFGVKNAQNIFVFNDVPLKSGMNRIKAVSGSFVDEITLNKVQQANETYVLIEDDYGDNDGAKNWFSELGDDIPALLEFKEVYFSIKDMIKDILIDEEATAILMSIFSVSGGFKPNPGMMKMLEGMKLEMVINMAGKKAPKGAKYIVNAKLQKIKKG